MSQEALLSPERLSLYAHLGTKIGNTPFVEIEGLLPNKNQLFVKQEFSNSLGESHYDRVYLALFFEKERLGIIRPGMNVFETTSGTAGVSFAAIGNALGYVCHVAVPDGGEKARERAIEEASGRIHFTPKEEYINGFPAFILKFKKAHGDYVFLNHSMGDIRGRGAGINRTAIESIYPIADEVTQQMNSKPIHHVISALGNGTNTLGLAERFHSLSPQTEISALEMISSGVGYSQKYGADAYRRLLSGMEPKSFSRHAMPGTSYPGIDFPALRESIAKVSRVLLVADEKAETEYYDFTGKSLPDNVVRFQQTIADPELAICGRSTIASIAVAKRLASQAHNQTFVVIGYDKSDRYDSCPQIPRRLLENDGPR